MRRRYAENTHVSVERSQSEIVRILRNAGVVEQGFATNEQRGESMVVFTLENRQARLSVKIPSIDELTRQAEAEPPRGWNHWSVPARLDYLRTKQSRLAQQRWRVLVIAVKTKLELIADGHSTFEREFLADLLLPNGKTVVEAVLPLIEDAYKTGRQPSLLRAFNS